MSLFIGARAALRLRLGFFPLGFRRVEGAHLRRLANGRLVRDGGRLRLRRPPPAILAGKVSRMCLEMMSLYPAGLSGMSERIDSPSAEPHAPMPVRRPLRL